METQRDNTPDLDALIEQQARGERVESEDIENEDEQPHRQLDRRTSKGDSDAGGVIWGDWE